MDDRIKTLRLTKFKGLNKSVNPHNVDDAEFTEMINIELSENRTLKSRPGFTTIIGALNTKVRSLFKVDWDECTSYLYCTRGNLVTAINETATPTETNVGTLLHDGRPTQFQRWKDKFLLLSPPLPLMWVNNTVAGGHGEVFRNVEYPRFQAGSNWNSALAASAGGTLEPNKYYQYTISFLLGDDLRDGETIGARPAVELVWSQGKYPKLTDVGDFPRCATTTTDLTITATAVTFSGQLHGFDLGLLRLFRRTAAFTLNTPQGDITYGEDTPWALIDMAYLNKENNTYSIIDRSTRGIISSITGTYNSTDDDATINVTFTDDGSKNYTAGEMPRDLSTETVPEAKYMARLGNRIFLANLRGNDPRDRKTVRFSYLGFLNENGVKEIPGFNYDKPMLIFGPDSWFYCDQEDTDDEITGMRGFQDTLIIFTGKNTFVWREGMSDPVKISNDIGCVGHHTIREFEGKLIWLSSNGVYSYDGANVRNLSAAKTDSYIEGMSKNYAWRAVAEVYNRRYYIAAPFSGGGDNNCALVYDFDLNEWAVREYRVGTTGYTFYIDYLYKYNDGFKEILYAAGHDSQATSASYVIRMDDAGNDGGAVIQCALKTKNYDLGAPDWSKVLRNFYIDVTNYSGALTFNAYLDNLNSAAYTHAHAGSSTGFIINDSNGVLNLHYIVNLTDEMLGFSLGSGYAGSRFQFGITFDAGASPTYIHAIGIDWKIKRKLQRKYGV